MSKIALIPMACKPFHAGHYNLIITASETHDMVICYVSSKDRIRKNEFPISGATMINIWNEILIPFMPENVEIRFVDNPIKSIWEFFDSIEKGLANTRRYVNTFSIFGDEKDTKQRFGNDTLKKYVPLMYKFNLVHAVPISRCQTNMISGTAMREYLENDDFNKFCLGLPEKMDPNIKEKIWTMLTLDSITSGYIKHEIVLEQVVIDYLKAFYQFNNNIDTWIKLKYELLRFLPSEYRNTLFTKRHPITKQQHPSRVEIEIMKIWVNMTKRPMIFNKDGKEFTINPA